MCTKIIGLIGLFVVLMCGFVKAQRTCYTGENKFGLCVPYQSCSTLVNAHKTFGDVIPESFYLYVKRSHCGNMNSKVIYICCEPQFVIAQQQQQSAPVPRSANTPTGTNNSPSRAPTKRRRPVARSDVATLNRQGVNILANTECGTFAGDRVAYGEETLLAEYPWMALLIYDSAPYKYLCGGSLITNRYVLTAAHCVYGHRYELTGIRLGEHDINKPIDCQPRGKEQTCSPPAEDYRIDNIVRHPDYTLSKKQNDLALVKLDRNVEFKLHITPVCLPITNKSRKAKLVEYIIAGWGTTEKGSASNVLLKAAVSHRDLEYCRGIFRNYEIADTNICAGGDKKTDSCKGDSGGPLFYLTEYGMTSRYVQYGVVSLGAAICDTPRTLPTLYTKLTEYIPWITQNIIDV